MEWANLLHSDTNLGMLNVNLIIIGCACSEMGEAFGNLKSHKWFEE